jgi:membrane associated rhomboid family serine protease
VIPLRDINPVQIRPVVTYVLIGINVAVWLLEVAVLMTGGPYQLGLLVSEWGVVPDKLLGPGRTLDWLTPLTSMFMHGGWFHVIGNMWFLWVFGDNVEEALGHVRYVVFYLACGLAAVVAQVAIDPASTVPMVGASGAIAGVLAAYVVLYPKARVLTLVPIFIFIQFVELPAFLFIFVWFGMQLLSGYASLGEMSQGGTAFFAHIGGFITGLALVFLLRRPRRGARSSRRVIHRPRGARRERWRFEDRPPH